MSAIQGRTALVTGGARGIGRAIGAALVGKGARVVLADVDELEAHRAAAAIGSEAVHLDVREPASWEAALGRAGEVDILVNNAGIMSLGALHAMEPDALRRQVDVNLWGVVHGLRAVLPGMQARGRGHVVNVASAAGKVGVPHGAMYSATKHAVVGLSEAVRYEVRDAGVSVTCVLPGFVDTELISGAGRPRWPPVVTVEQVAAATVDAIERDRVEVYVPRAAMLSALLPVLLPRFLVERVGRLLGVDRLFVDVDAQARAAYERRARG